PAPAVLARARPGRADLPGAASGDRRRGVRHARGQAGARRRLAAGLGRGSRAHPLADRVGLADRPGDHRTGPATNSRSCVGRIGIIRLGLLRCQERDGLVVLPAWEQLRPALAFVVEPFDAPLVAVLVRLRGVAHGPAPYGAGRTPGPWQRSPASLP